MKALIVIAHGSRREESNNEIVEMVTRISMQLEAGYKLVQHAFLEVCEPSLATAVESVVKKGAKEIFVYPYFLNSGNHVQRDIPGMIEELNTTHSSCDIHMLTHFGKQEDIATLITRHVSQE
ncbi:MAG: CbiX/SirB N-terminal domain-containing protein [Gammaproteobacteria bacterium]